MHWPRVELDTSRLFVSVVELLDKGQLIGLLAQMCHRPTRNSIWNIQDIVCTNKLY
jgi:hypothetical protein